MPQKTCIVVAGPTAVGKTAAAITLARHFNTSIISADSRQCYKELNIGVAKPDSTQLEAVRHYFINSHSITEDVNAAVFESYALAAAEEIFRSSDYVIMVGGTGLYIQAFCNGIDPIPPIPPAIRQKVISGYNEAGLSWLQEQVSVQDPGYFAGGETSNPQRLMRALEVKLHTGVSITSFHTASVTRRPFEIVKTALELPRAELYRNINHRVDEMMEAGLLGEVSALTPHAHRNALQTVGYSELFDYLNGMSTLETAVENIKKHTRHYAKRQMTWFRKDQAFQWFHPADEKGLIDFITARDFTW
jgi:tRNA dimethylallyltransferase